MEEDILCMHSSITKEKLKQKRNVCKQTPRSLVVQELKLICKAFICPSKHVQKNTVLNTILNCAVTWWVFFPSGCWAVVSMVFVWPHNSLFHELQGQKEVLYAVKLSLERRPWGLAEGWHAPFWQEESDLWAARSIWRVGKEVTCIFLKADEFHLGWQCHNNFQPFTPTSASLILLPVLAEAFINQYSSQLLVWMGRSDRSGKWELFFGSRWWWCWLKVVMEPQYVTPGTHRF